MKFFTILCLILISENSISKEIVNNFEKGEEKYFNKYYEEAKIFFEKNIVFNTKNTNSYLYLSKIHKILKNYDEEERNLNTAIMLEPKNEDALYLIIELYIKQGEFKLAEKKYDLLKKICKKNCIKLSKVKKLIAKSK